MLSHPIFFFENIPNRRCKIAKIKTHSRIRLNQRPPRHEITVTDRIAREVPVSSKRYPAHLSHNSFLFLAGLASPPNSIGRLSFCHCRLFVCGSCACVCVNSLCKISSNVRRPFRHRNIRGMHGNPSFPFFVGSTHRRLHHHSPSDLAHSIAGIFYAKLRQHRRHDQTSVGRRPLVQLAMMGLLAIWNQKPIRKPRCSGDIYLHH